MWDFLKRFAPVTAAPAKPAPRAPAPAVSAIPDRTRPAKGKTRLGMKSTLAALCVSTVGGFEGLRQTAYPDPATGREPWTVCYGETAGVKRGDRYTVAECKVILAKSLDGYAARMEACVTRDMPDTTYAAFLSLSYNIGSGGFCKSSVVRLWNAGQERAACDAMLKWNRAANIVFPGLTRRRTEERALCLKDL